MTTETIEQEQAHRSRMIRTVVKNIDIWEENISANKPLITNDVSELWIDGNGGEYICVAAGPSLKDDLPKLKELSKDKTIVCVDMAYKYLVDNGVEPDYVISTDASKSIAGLLHVEMQNADLILNVIAHPNVAKSWRNKIYWFIMANQFYDADKKEMIETIHSRLSGIGGKLVPGGNVSSLALGFALSMRSASKVYLFGFDFCWKDEMYCGGVNKELADKRMEMESDAGTIYDDANTKGEGVKTNLSLKQYAKWHEETAQNFPGRVVNCTSSTILKI